MLKLLTAQRFGLLARCNAQCEFKDTLSVCSAQAQFSSQLLQAKQFISMLFDIAAGQAYQLNDCTLVIAWLTAFTGSKARLFGGFRQCKEDHLLASRFARR